MLIDAELEEPVELLGSLFEAPLRLSVVVPDSVSPAAPVRPVRIILGGCHDLLYAILAADLELRPVLSPMAIWAGIRAAEPQLRVLSPKQIAHTASVHLDNGRLATVDGVEDSLTFLELYRGFHRYHGMNVWPNRHAMEDFMSDWLCPFIGRKIEQAPRLSTALREALWTRISEAADPAAVWTRYAQPLTSRYQMSEAFLAGRP